MAKAIQALSLKRALVSSAIIALITLLLFLLVEGASSVIFIARGPPGQVLKERSHTEHDPELGWINEASVRIEDLYGPGTDLQTNAQRFRNRKEFAQKVPRGKLRVICTGDSFTLGYGVGNDQAWCQLLTRKDPRFEAVNMGQGGYGVDQAYLWYRRDGLPLEHDALVFAFVPTDIERMMSDMFIGYPKPVLQVENGRPVLAQRPSSKLAFVAPWLRQRLSHFAALRSLELLRPAAPPAQTLRPVMNEEQARRLLLAIVDDLQAIHAKRGTSMLVVALPGSNENLGEEGAAWRSFLGPELAQRKIAFLDLIAAVKNVPPTLLMRLFGDHYTEIGNQWVADAVYERLVELPRLSQRLKDVGAPANPVTRLVQSGTLEPLAWDAVHVQASSMPEIAALASDGDLATRWHSGGIQNGSESIVLDLGSLRTVRQLRLDPGEMASDWGRSLALDVAGEDRQYREVLSIVGQRVLADNVDRPGLSQVVWLPDAVPVRYVRIRQLGKSDENWWSVAEVQVYVEK